MVYGEASTLAVKYSLLLKQSYNELVKAGDSTEAYLVEVRLKDSNGKFIKAAKGYSAYSDEQGLASSTFFTAA